ncbi:MAG: Gfo/Idh/MocA family oxidoreductase [Spirochaetia bacterium]
MTTEVKIGMIGTSGIARIGHLPSLIHHPKAKVVAICGRNKETADEVAKEFNIPAVFSAYREMIDKAGLDAVVIATPEDLHHPMTMAALGAKLHVLCEKPLALTLEQATEMYETAQSADLIHATFFTFRWYPWNRYFKELIETGYVGRPFHFAMRWPYASFQKTDDYHWKRDKARSTGALGGAGSHLIDMARWIFGDVRRVGATVKTFRPVVDPEMSSVETSNDSAIVTLDFVNGVHGVIDVGSARHAGVQPYASVSGENGRLGLIMEPPGGPPIMGAQGEEDELKPIEIPDRFYEGVDRTKSGFELIMEIIKKQPIGGYAFVDSILNNKVVPPSFYEGLKTQEIIDAAFRSDETNTLVTLGAHRYE